MDYGRIMAVVCGGLNMLRCFTDGKIPTVLVTSRANDPTLYSRYCQDKAIISDWGSCPQEAMVQLVDLAKQYRQKPVLFYGDDKLLLLISRNREIFSRHFRFSLPPSSLIENLVDKTKFKQLAQELDLPTPRSLVSHQVSDLKAFSNSQLSLPYIVKPNYHIGWFQSEAVKKFAGGQPQKGLVAHTQEEFREIWEEVRKFTKDFVVQEYIAGGEDQIYSFHGYMNEQMEPLGCFIGKKIRTYPHTCGESCFLELIHEPEVMTVGLEVVKKLSLIGPVKLDFKRDQKRNAWYLLEVNPRFTLWNYLGTVCGVNLPQIAFADLTGEQVKRQEIRRTGVRWLAFGMDFRAFIKGYHPSGELSWYAWLKSLGGPKIYSCFAWLDPLPFFVASRQFWGAQIEKLSRKLIG